MNTKCNVMLAALSKGGETSYIESTLKVIDSVFKNSLSLTCTYGKGSIYDERNQ